MELTTAPKTAGYPSKTWWDLEVVKLLCDLDFKYILDSTAPTQDGPEITDLAFNVAAKHKQDQTNHLDRIKRQREIEEKDQDETKRIREEMVATEQAKVDCLTQLTTALTGFLVPAAATVPAPEVQAQAARLEAMQTRIDLVETKIDQNSTDMRAGFAALMARFPPA